MRHSGDLATCAKKGGSGSFVEHKKWVTASRLFGQAHAAGEEMPVFFSAAERDSGLIYWAVLASIWVDDGDPANGISPTTTYAFNRLVPIAPPRKLSVLRLLRTGSALSDNYIRPYAVCQTPLFLP